MDDAAYLALMDRILVASTEQQLIALVHDILLTGEARFDFGETWMMRWDAVTNHKAIPAGLWP
jgi:hypothetical protein